MTAEDLAQTLDAAVTAQWNDALESVQALPIADQLDVLNLMRASLSDWRENARRGVVDFLVSRGVRVPADFGLPCRALALTLPEGNA